MISKINIVGNVDNKFQSNDFVLQLASIGAEGLVNFITPKARFNPPLIDLDSYRIEISRTITPRKSDIYDAFIINVDGSTRRLKNKKGRYVSSCSSQRSIIMPTVITLQFSQNSCLLCLWS